ncbi:MAG: pentapeptide repeat-containing protein, partial [Acidobacteria bacterium]|nr:pentapeptide repeat-containing protein [Acidobacteriota bacterium]
MFHGRPIVCWVCLLTGAALLCAATPIRGDIYQWAWVDPSDPNQGKIQSTKRCPGGAGVSAAPYAQLANRDLTQAYLIGGNLNYANLYSATLSNADLTNANLTGANFYLTTLW